MHEKESMARRNPKISVCWKGWRRVPNGWVHSEDERVTYEGGRIERVGGNRAYLFLQGLEVGGRETRSIVFTSPLGVSTFDVTRDASNS